MLPSEILLSGSTIVSTLVFICLVVFNSRSRFKVFSLGLAAALLSLLVEKMAGAGVSAFVFRKFENFHYAMHSNPNLIPYFFLAVICIAAFIEEASKLGAITILASYFMAHRTATLNQCILVGLGFGVLELGLLFFGLYSNQNDIIPPYNYAVVTLLAARAIVLLMHALTSGIMYALFLMDRLKAVYKISIIFIPAWSIHTGFNLIITKYLMMTDTDSPTVETLLVSLWMLVFVGFMFLFRRTFSTAAANYK